MLLRGSIYYHVQSRKMTFSNTSSETHRSLFILNSHPFPSKSNKRAEQTSLVYFIPQQIFIFDVKAVLLLRGPKSVIAYRSKDFPLNCVCFLHRRIHDRLFRQSQCSLFHRLFSLPAQNRLSLIAAISRNRYID